MKNLVNDIGLDKFYGAELLNYHIESKQFMDNCGAENMSCTNELNDYDAAIEAIKDNMRRQQASAITPKLEIIDTERDSLLNYVYSLLDAGKYSPIEATQEAYQELYPAMQPYRGTINKPVTQESADIVSLINEINKPAMAPHLNTLGMTDGVTMLAEKNQEYIDLDMQRISETPSKKETQTVRKNADAIYKNIVIHINATITLNENDSVILLKDNLNNLINRTNIANKKRIAMARAAEKKRKEKEKEKELAEMIKDESQTTND